MFHLSSLLAQLFDCNVRLLSSYKNNVDGCVRRFSMCCMGFGYELCTLVNLECMCGCCLSSNPASCVCLFICVCATCTPHRNLSMFPLSAGGSTQPGPRAGQQQHGTGLRLRVQERRRRGGHCSVPGGHEGQHGAPRGPGSVHRSLQLCDPPLRPAAARGEPGAGRADQAGPGGGPEPVSHRNTGEPELHDQVRVLHTERRSGGRGDTSNEVHQLCPLQVEHDVTHSQKETLYQHIINYINTRLNKYLNSS